MTRKNNLSDRSGAGGQVATHSPLTSAARIKLPHVALSSLTQATILLESVKRVASSKRWETAGEDHVWKLPDANIKRVQHSSRIHPGSIAVLAVCVTDHQRYFRFFAIVTQSTLTTLSCIIHLRTREVSLLQVSSLMVHAETYCHRIQTSLKQSSSEQTIDSDLRVLLM